MYHNQIWVDFDLMRRCILHDSADVFLLPRTWYLTMPTTVYNSEIWNLPSLKTTLKQKLLRVSAKAIKICMFYPDPMVSFINVHVMNERAPPESILLYVQAVQFKQALTGVDLTKYE